MRAFVRNSMMTKFMQAADVFEKTKLVYEDIELGYKIDDTLLKDEESIAYLAKAEFKENLIALFGINKPFYINPNVQTVSNGKQWFLLYDFLVAKYPSLKFKSNDRFMNIEFEF